MRTTAIVPCHGRDSFHEVFIGYKPFGKAVFDPVFYVGRNLVVCRWVEVVEQAIDRRSEGDLAVMKARSVGYSCRWLYNEEKRDGNIA